MGKDTFRCTDQEDNGKLQPLGLVDGHQRNPVALLLQAGLAAQLIPLGNISNEFEEDRDTVEPFSRGLQLVQHFFERLPVQCSLVPFIGFNEIVIEVRADLADRLHRCQRRQTADQLQPVPQLSAFEILHARHR
ncbi:hypothetical protein D3C81_1881770 [compost metagenome]